MQTRNISKSSQKYVDIYRTFKFKVGAVQICDAADAADDEGEETAVDSSVLRGPPEKKQLGKMMLLHGLELLLSSMHAGQLLLALLGKTLSG